MPEATESMDFAAMAAPVEQHERLRPFVGTFKAEVKMWMGPGDPMITTGTMTNTMELGDRFLSQSYQGDPCEGPFPEFAGKGYWGFNKNSSKYEGFWIDTASTQMQVDSGDIDASGKVWTMLSTVCCPAGGEMQKRTIITLQDNDHHSTQMFFAPKDQDEMKGMEINYTRI